MDRFELLEVSSSGQSWQIEQLNSGVMAIANNSGVLFYDGSSFTVTEVPGTTFAFASAPNGRIYVGTALALGYLEPDITGAWQFHSLPAPEGIGPYGEIGRITYAFGRVFYLSRRKLLVYAEDQGWRHFGSSVGFSELQWREPDVLVFDDAQGWLAFDPATSRLESRGGSFPGKTLGTSSRAAGEPWYASDEQGLLRRIGGVWQRFAVEQSSTLAADRIEAIERLGNGDVAVGTRFGGLYQFRSDGTLRRRIAIASLPGERITGLHVDREASLWLAMDGGIARLELDHRVTRFQRAQGATQVERIARIDGALFIATRRGLKRLAPSMAPGAPASFVDHRIVRRSAWSLLATEHGLLVGVGNGLAFLPKDMAAEPVNVFQGPYTPGLVAYRDWIYAASGDQLVRLRWVNGAFVADPERVQLSPVFDLVQSDDALWLSINGGGVYRVDALEQWPKPQVKRLGKADGLPEGWTTFGELDDRLLVLANGYPRVWQDGAFTPDVRFAPELRFNRFQPIDARSAWVGRDQADGGDSLQLLVRGEDGVFRPAQSNAFPLSRFRHPARHVWLDADGTLWLGDDTGVLRMSAPPDVVRPDIPIVLRSVRGSAERPWLAGPGTATNFWTRSLPADQRALVAQLSWPAFASEHATQWLVRKQGRRWREIDPNAWRISLAQGENRFQIKAIDASGFTSPVGRLSLTVAPYWYERTSVRMLALVALLVAIWLAAIGLSHRRTQRLERERVRLEALVAERTADVRRQADEIRLLSDARTRFFGNVSHEFRTPLTLILNPLSDAVSGRMGEVSQRVKAALETALANARRLLTLVSELLDMNRLSAGSFVLHVAEHDVIAQLRRELRAFADLAESRGVELQGALGDQPLSLWYDADQLERMVGNLLGNALKFTPNGGWVKVEVVADPTEVAIVVTDSGPGIPAEEQSRVFERYFQGSAAASTEAPGTGIGLALVRELITLHRGRIALHSQPGNGSRFELRFRRGHEHFDARQLAQPPLSVTVLDPSGVPGAADAREMPEALSERAQFEVLRRDGDRMLPKLLVIDDHAELRHYLADRLSEAFEVSSAGDGREALKVMAEDLPDVVVSDVMMAGMDGLDLVRHLRSNLDTAGIPIILLSARAHKRDIVLGLQSGADDYLTKPFDTSELLARIETQMQIRHRLREQLLHEHGSAPAAPAQGASAPTSLVSAISGSSGTPDDPAGDAAVATIEVVPASERGSVGAEVQPMEAPSGDRFTARLQAALERHMADPGFGVSELAEVMHMDRATLFRKLKSLGHGAPSELLREHRLQKAAELLRCRRGNVSEVAYAVGYDNLSHFSQAFRKRFGTAPSAMLG